MSPRTTLSLPVLTAVVLGACSGGSKGDPDNRGPFQVTLISTGQGQIYPYRIRQVDSQGNPTPTIVNIESEAILKQLASTSNPVLPVATFPLTASLPGGGAGNHFVLMRFSHKLRIESILSPLLANATTNSGLTTAVSLIAYDPISEQTTVVRGRGFVGGFTYFNRGGQLELVQAVARDGDTVRLLDAEATGFPMGFSGDVDLVAPNSFVFVADRDDNLSTLETFDEDSTNRLIRIIVTNSVRDSDDAVLEQELCTATTVGPDPNPGDVIGFTPNKQLAITPGNGAQGVDPLTEIQIAFNKPVQPAEVGFFFTTTNLTPPSGGISLSITIATSTFTVLYYADPLSFGDFCNYRIRPLYSFPGSTTITVNVNNQAITDLRTRPLSSPQTTTFKTGVGPGVINAPVSPDAVYVGIGGADPGISVIDLNGYGQGTSSSDPSQSYFALNNPNIGQPGIVPPLAPGTSELDAGSKGPLTLVEDTKGKTKLIGSPMISQITDIQIGAPLDVVFNNSNINVNAGSNNQLNPVIGILQPGNTISVVPHPNPPRLVFPPPNPSRAIFAEEPTFAGGNNLLTPSTRPDFRPRAVTGFVGPAPPPPSPPPPPSFQPFSARQQIGHFLYVLDRDLRQVLVINSNRFTVLDRISLTDPIDMAMSPSLGLMAVANFSSSSISIIDTNPFSATFNQIVSESRLDDFPRKVVWQPEGEVILAIGTNTLSVLNGGDFSVQNVVSGNIVDPIDLVITERYCTTGNQSQVFYSYILNADGTVAVYESGPSGTNGIGFDDMIGLVDPTFRRPRTIKMDYISGLGGFYVSHADESNVAIISHCQLTSSPTGPLQTNQQTGTGFLLPPTFRQKIWSVTESFGGSDPTQPLQVRFSGNSISDFAFDEMFNNGALPNQTSPFSGIINGQSIVGHSSKGSVLGAGATPFQPAFLFVALVDVGKIDVIDLVARITVKSIDVPGVSMLATYWRQ